MQPLLGPPASALPLVSIRFPTSRAERSSLCANLIMHFSQPPTPPPWGLVASGSSPALRPGLQDLCFLILLIPASNPIMAHISLSLSSYRDCSLCLELAPSARSQSIQAATIYHKLGNLNSRHFFLTVVEAGSLRSGFWHGWALVRGLILVCRQPPSCCILV